MTRWKDFMSLPLFEQISASQSSTRLSLLFGRSPGSAVAKLQRVRAATEKWMLAYSPRALSMSWQLAAKE
jgi:hypothetical protein